MNRFLVGRNRREFAATRKNVSAGLSPTEVWPRNDSRPSRGTLLAQQGRRGLVDTEGEIGTSEDPEQVARREFAEELGPAAKIGTLHALGEIRRRGGKRVIAFYGETDFDTAMLSGNTFKMEWPPKSGKLLAFPGG
jgi:predicted NUDIX family NTP pyrophosphohydrolase